MTQVKGIAEKQYLSDQYRDSSNLEARMVLHHRFSTNPYGWLQWVFDRFDFPPACRILEVGCGPGNLWLENAGRIPRGWKITLSDSSAGMVRQARENLGRDSRCFRYANLDAQALPFPGGSFGAVIANHMLYHVPERNRAIREFHRVLRPGGCLCASTIGRAHMRELTELAHSFDPASSEWGSRGLAEESFSLENGARQLSRYFSAVSLHRYEDSLAVTESAPLIAYLLSARIRLDEGRHPALAAHVKKQMRRGGGVFRITKDTGLFLAVRG